MNTEQYRANWAAIFGEGCKSHPEYTADAAPTHDCIVCRRLWREKELNL